LDYHLPLAAAMNGPRIHEQDFPDRIGCEAHGFLPQTLEALRRMGHTIKEEENQSTVATILRVRGAWQGMAEPRGEGSAGGY
jgi:gamma-glutamyltranspeptidase/glutathione hydrolase